jgi:hypothetical protein
MLCPDRWLKVGTFAISAACSSPDLPRGWDNAEHVDHFTQSECQSSAQTAEVVEMRGGDGVLEIDYLQARFRCAQDVEGFVKTSGSEIDLLVQPVDMDPSSVAKCDCSYDITMKLDALPSGEHRVSVYRRSDHLDDRDSPTLVASELVAVQ